MWTRATATAIHCSPSRLLTAISTRSCCCLAMGRTRRRVITRGPRLWSCRASMDMPSAPRRCWRRVPSSTQSGSTLHQSSGHTSSRVARARRRATSAVAWSARCQRVEASQPTPTGTACYHRQQKPLAGGVRQCRSRRRRQSWVAAATHPSARALQRAVAGQTRTRAAVALQ